MNASSVHHTSQVAQLHELGEGAIVDHYEVIRAIGKGGMGSVYLARDLKLGRLVAVKLLHPKLVQESPRVLVEARAIAKCRHENIVVIHDLNQYQGLPYLVLEYLEGSSLQKWYAERTLPHERALELFCSILRGLEHAHANGIIHRDLKPDNVFITEAGVPKLLDFGIAKLHSAPVDTTGSRPPPSPDESETHLPINDRGPIGTYLYMSPEQLRGDDDIDHRTDIWSVGIMMFKFFTGGFPYGKAYLLVADTSQPTPSVASVAPDLDPRLVSIIDRCLQKERDYRYANAREVIDDLEHMLPRARVSADRCPYPGLQSFDEGDAQRFFGRSGDVARAVARLQHEPMLAVVGPSGAGKSSFIRAGLIPALRAAHHIIPITIRPGRRPLAGLAQLIAQLINDPAYAQQVISGLPTEPGYLGLVLRYVAQVKHARVLLLVDQLEELYTHASDRNERIAFVSALRAAADDPSSPIRVVLSLRSDFLDRAAEDRLFMEAVSRGLHYLMPLGRDGLRDALVRPLALAGHAFESPELVESMLDEIATTAGALPLLQFAAAQMWDMRDRSARVLTRASYLAMNGIGGTLAAHADRVLADMPPQRRALARAVFRRLVTPDGTRAIVDLAELVAMSPQEVPSLVDTLVSARLLVTNADQQTAAATVEIAHESLLTAWPQLREWMDADREEQAFIVELRQAAQQWDVRGRPAGLLWRGEVADEAKRFSTRLSVGPREHAFLSAVHAMATRSSRIKRIAVIATMIGLFVLLVAGGIVVVRVRAAEQRARTEAVEADKARGELADQLTVVKQKEAERAAAEDKAKAEAERASVEAKKANEAGEKVKQSREELEQSNAQLQKALATAEQARAREESERQKVEKLLEAEKRRVNQLENQKKKIATELH